MAAPFRFRASITLAAESTVALSHVLLPMSYNVYLVSSQGLPRSHHAIFFEIEADGSGFTFQVTGNIQQGMTHDHKGPAEKPENSDSFVSKVYLGSTSHGNYKRVEEICNAIEPPRKQFDGPTRLYPGVPLRRCQEWTQEAIAALKDAGVIEA